MVISGPMPEAGRFPCLWNLPCCDSWESVGQARLSAPGPSARWLTGPKGEYYTKDPSWKNSECKAIKTESSKVEPGQSQVYTAPFSPSWWSWTRPEPGPNGGSKTTKKVGVKGSHCPCCGSVYVAFYVTIKIILK